MNIEQEFEGRAVLRCPKCQSLLTEAADSWIRCINVAFPDQLRAVHALVVGAMDFFLCPVCEEPIRKPTLSLCLIRPLNLSLVYIPPELEPIPGETLSDLVQQHWKVKGHKISELETFSKSLAFRRRACQCIGQLVLPLYKECRVAFTENRGPHWVMLNQDRLNFDFFSGLWLFGQPYLPVKFNEEPSNMHAQLRSLLSLRLNVLAGKLVDTSTINKLPTPVEELIPSEAVSDEFVDAFGATVTDIQKAENEPTPFLYALHAVFASVCLLAEKTNPRKDDWTSLYVLFEYLTRIEPDIPVEVRATPKLAAQTVSVRVLWDMYAECENKLQTKELGPEEHDSAALRIETILRLVRELGFEQQWAEFITERLKLGEFPNEKLDEVLDSFAAKFRTNPNMLYFLFRPVQRELIKRDPNRLRSFVKRVRQEALEANRISDAIWVTVVSSEEWNKLSMTSTAHKEVNDCIDALKSVGLWPPASDKDRIMLLTEDGNCLRWLLRCRVEAKPARAFVERSEQN